MSEEKNKFQFSTDTCDEFSFIELRDELEEVLHISSKTPSTLQYEK